LPHFADFDRHFYWKFYFGGLRSIAIAAGARVETLRTSFRRSLLRALRMPAG
jgi:hypothetical protein